jgi:hypothetical protein
LKKILIVTITAVLAAGLALSGCAQNYNAAPSGSLTGPSVSLSGTPYRSAGPSASVTIDVTPLPGPSVSAEPDGRQPAASTAGAPTIPGS